MEKMWIRCLELVSLLLSLLLLTIPISCASAQHPVGEENSTLICSPGGPCPIYMLENKNNRNNENPDVTILFFRGAANRGNESHFIRLILELISSVDPAEARRLLESNASLREIRSSFMAEEKALTLAGNIKLSNDIYRLINITVANSGNNSILQANVIGPIAGPRSGLNKSNAKVGNIIIKIALFDNAESSEGALVMNDSNYDGTYKLLLERQFPGRGPRVGLMA